MLLRSILVGTTALCSYLLVAQRLPEKTTEELRLAGFNASDLGELVVKDHYRTAHNGVTHSYFRQRWQGIEVWNGDIAVHQLPSGEVVKVNNGAFSGIEKRVNTTVPVITPEGAFANVLARTMPGTRAPQRIAVDNAGQIYLFENSAFGGERASVQLVYQPKGEALLLAWNVNHYVPGGLHWWNVRVDALTGEELDRNDWVVNCGRADHDACDEDPCAASAPAAPNDYNIYPWPLESPIHGSRAIRNAPWTTGGIASPFGWHDTNGAAGAEFTDTRGNNCYAQDDADANNTGGTRPSGGANLDFDFTLDLTGAPSTYLNVATTNLFYWNNIIHDVWYQYGFDDPAGNFQQNNYGRGGAGNDYVNADAQDGSGTNNANFGTPPDGSAPRMQMYRWTYTTPNRDSDLDNGIIAHEYGHGISNRLVGGPANTSCLGNAEQMGEGWSDYFGLIMTIEPGDLGTDGRGIGTYVLGQSTTGAGIRPARYSTSLATNNFTYAATNNTSAISQPHGIGFVWCTMLWEMTWELINVYGLDPDIYNGNGGNNIAMQLVIDGLKLTPCNPGFVGARDAILQADMINNAGANQNYIWAAFARRGLGVSASQGSSSSRTDQTEAFDTPLPTNVGIATVIAPTGSMLDCATTNTPVSVTVRNYGQVVQSNFAVRYQLDGAALVTETFTGTLAPGASANYTFTQLLTITGNGAHSLVASTNLAGDQFAGNDAATSSITVSTPSTIAAPFLQNIETTSPTPAGWALQNPDNASTWVTAAVNGQSACVGTRAWAIDFYSVNLPGQEDRIVTPLVDLSASAGTHLKFQHAYSGYGAGYDDGLRVEISNNCGLTWTTLYQATGNALRTVPYNTSAWAPATCADWLAHDIDISAYDGGNIIVRFVAINAYGNWLYLDNAQVESNGVKVALKLMLEGAYDANTDRMRDDIRAANQIPLAEPYTALGFAQAGNGGGETINPSVLATTGDNAIVDWVQLQLRNSATPSTVVATRCVLVQRDGDVVEKDGTSPVTFLAGPGSYYIAARHRNHLGTMTAATVPLTATTTSLDLSNTATIAYGTEAMKPFDGLQMLWAGNVLTDPTLRYVGEFNDRDPILQAIGGSIPTNVSAAGYFIEDVNMDSVVRYVGEGNDRDPILTNIGGSIPTNTRAQQLP